jgi:hypothetical protein
LSTASNAAGLPTALVAAARPRTRKRRKGAFHLPRLIKVARRAAAVVSAASFAADVLAELNSVSKTAQERTK